MRKQELFIKFVIPNKPKTIYRRGRVEDSELAFFYANYVVMRRAKEYGRRSYRAEFQNETPYFDQIGTYTDQVFYIWYILDFWNNPVPYWDDDTKVTIVKKYTRRPHYNPVFTGYGDYEDSHDCGEDVKYLSKLNGGFNITRFTLSGHAVNGGYSGITRSRIESVYPGKFGGYEGMARRTHRSLLSWWNHLFTPMVALAERRKVEFLKSGVGEETFRQYLTFRLLTVNNQLLRYFFLLKRYILLWPDQNITLSIEYNFKKFNLIWKKKRYLKKYKRRSILTTDRIIRQTLLVQKQRTF